MNVSNIVVYNNNENNDDDDDALCVSARRENQAKPICRLINRCFSSFLEFCFSFVFSSAHASSHRGGPSESRTLCRRDQVENLNIRTKTLCVSPKDQPELDWRRRTGKKGKMYLCVCKIDLTRFCFLFSFFFLIFLSLFVVFQPVGSGLSCEIVAAVVVFFFVSHLLFLVSRFHRWSLAPPPAPCSLGVSLNGRWLWKQVGHAVRDHTHTHTRINKGCNIYYGRGTGRAGGGGDNRVL